MSLPLVALPELMSIESNASVRSRTSEPPEDRATWRSYMVAILLSS